MKPGHFMLCLCERSITLSKHHPTVRMVYDDKYSDYQRLLLAHKHLDIYKLCLKSLFCVMYKIWNNVSPTYLSDIFKKNEQSSYNLRDKSTFILPTFAYKKHGYHCIDFIGSKVWNDLPVQVKDKNSLMSLKHTIKCHLLDHESYILINKYF